MSIIKNIKKYLYYGLSILLYISYLAVFFGIYVISPEYLKTAINSLEFLICAILIIKFHPFQTAKLEKYDQPLIFLCATIILTNLGITNYILTNIGNKVKPILNGYVHR